MTSLTIKPLCCESVHITKVEDKVCDVTKQLERNLLQIETANCIFHISINAFNYFQNESTK